MANVNGVCRKCGTRYGSYAGLKAARNEVSKKDCKKGGKCEADV